MPKLSLVDLKAQPVDRLRAIISDDRFERFHRTMSDTADVLNGRTVWNVNSTAEGGGVAEMLGTLLPYAIDTGWDVKWAVMSGETDFFEVTKGLHNTLHGTPPTDENIWDHAGEIYGRVTETNAAEMTPMIRPGDVVLIHDPQAAGLIGPLKQAGAAVSWQCHIGTDDPNDYTRQAWDFLRPFVDAADRYVFTREAYLWEGLDAARLRVIPPSIDALSPKNAPLEAERVRDTLRASGVMDGLPGDTKLRRVTRVGGEACLPADARVVLQVSRWDRLKDPIGFLRIYAEHLTDREDVHLVHAGPATNGVGDDPEGADVVEACAEVWRSFEPSVQERVHLLEVPMSDIDENAVIVNAMQCRADVVVQKSLEEGFGLTVAEAMWKSRPVVASRVGGIQDQIEHDRSGLLVDDPYDIAAFATAVRSLLDDPDRAARLGSAAHDRVCDHFLGPRQLEQYADLLVELAHGERAA
jgi:trehalose synthase